MIQEQDTIPLLKIWDSLPTVQQVREVCKWSYFELASLAGVKPRVVYWMEKGIAVHAADASKVLAALSLRTGRPYTLQNVHLPHLRPDGVAPVERGLVARDAPAMIA